MTKGKVVQPPRWCSAFEDGGGSPSLARETVRLS